MRRLTYLTLSVALSEFKSDSVQICNTVKLQISRFNKATNEQHCLSHETRMILFLSSLHGPSILDETKRNLNNADIVNDWFPAHYAQEKWNC